MKSANGKTEDPAVEVAVEVNSDNGEIGRLAVFIEGRRIEPSKVHEIHFNGGSATWLDLRLAAWDATREGTAGFVALLDRWYRHAEGFAVGGENTNAAEQIQPDITYAAKLDPSLWFASSRPGTVTRKAAQAAVAVRVFHTCNWQSYGPKAVVSALGAYRAAIHHPRRGAFDVLLCSLLTDLRHLAEAYKIRLDSGWERGDAALTFDLTEVYREIRDAARTQWAPLLAKTGRSADDVEFQAFVTFLADFSRT